MKQKQYEALMKEETIVFCRSNFFSTMRTCNHEAMTITAGQVHVLRLTNLSGCDHGFLIVRLSYSDCTGPIGIQGYPQYSETYYTTIDKGLKAENNTIPLFPELEGKTLHSVSFGLCSLTEKATLQLTVSCVQIDQLRHTMKKQDCLPKSEKAVPFNIIHDWEDDLSWCPSQCRLKVEYLEHHFILLLHWRHQDPWTAEFIECKPDGAFRPLNNEDAVHPLDIGHWKESDLKFAKHYAVERMREWLRKKCCEEDLF